MVLNESALVDVRKYCLDNAIKILLSLQPKFSNTTGSEDVILGTESSEREEENISPEDIIFLAEVFENYILEDDEEIKGE